MFSGNTKEWDECLFREATDFFIVLLEQCDKFASQLRVFFVIVSVLNEIYRVIVLKNLKCCSIKQTFAKMIFFTYSVM